MTQNNQLSLVIEPAELEPLLGSEGLLIVDLCNPQVYQQLHVPGAIHVHPQTTTLGTQPAPGKLPTLRQLEELFQSIGYTGEEHIVVYDDEGGGWAGRFIWLLDVIGHRNYSYLNGGLHAWIKEDFPKENKINKPLATNVSLTIDDSVTATTDYIINNIGNDHVKIWDARSPSEYTGERVLARRGGHIPGAVNFEWTNAMSPENNYRIKENLLAELISLGLTPEQEIITHCQTHHRSGFTYLVSKFLGFKSVKAYDGSWSEWGNLLNTPIES
ncbi:thiosulfate sulfurtransferase [Endozoicomonas sp. (ex Bugula neritina AB1)]|nr:thiosulfate sulfurtransferase [Endozoicomonas sp. (ex Bugula neritina AB1)]